LTCHASRRASGENCRLAGRWSRRRRAERPIRGPATASHLPGAVAVCRLSGPCMASRSRPPSVVHGGKTDDGTRLGAASERQGMNVDGRRNRSPVCSVCANDRCTLHRAIPCRLGVRVSQRPGDDALPTTATARCELGLSTRCCRPAPRRQWQQRSGCGLPPSIAELTLTAFNRTPDLATVSRAKSARQPRTRPGLALRRHRH